MYRTDYFVRFVLDSQQARRDLRRGYSFSGYVFSARKAEARDFWRDLGVSDPDLGRCREGWGLRLAGLCGFGPFASAEEAAEFARNRRGYNGVAWQTAAIYEGRWVASCDDGDVFRALRLAKVIKL